MKYSTNLIQHMRTIHNVGEPPLKKKKHRVCPKCNRKFTSNYLMFHHLKTVHKVAKPHKCSHCDKCFKTSTELSIHRGTHPEVAPHACNICPMRYKSKLYLQKHRELTGHFETSDTVPYTRKEFQCQKCKKVFLWYVSFKSHVTNFEGGCSRDDDRPICKCCGESYENQSDLKQHFVSEHKEFNIVSTCKKGGRNGNQVRTKSERSPCPVCNKMLDLHGLKYHRNLHEGVKPFKCDQCDYRAVIRQDVTKHIRFVHNNERRFQCEFCCRRFKTKTEARVHRDFHLGIKRFECKICKRKFLDKGRCKDHGKMCKVGKARLFTNNPYAPSGYRCRWCGAMYSNQSALSQHLKVCELKGGADYEVPQKKDAESSQDEQPDNQEGEEQQGRLDFLPWCKYCGGIFKDHESIKGHKYECMVEHQKETGDWNLGMEEKKSGNADKDNDNDNNISSDPKPITINIVKPRKRWRAKSTSRKRPLNEQNQKELATDKIFSPFKFTCEVCGKDTEELIKEFCLEHYTFCSFCEKAFRYDENLKMHLNEHEEKQEESKTPESLVCKTCRKTTEELIEAHITKHPYHCLKCKLTFTAESNLHKHQREHKIKVLYNCDQCEATFTSKKKLKTHQRDHNKGPNTNQGAVQNIKKLNTNPGDIPYMYKKADGTYGFKVVCPSCPEKFDSKSERDIHEREVHGKEIYKCCGCSFETIYDLNRHQETKRHKRNVVSAKRKAGQLAEHKAMMNFDVQMEKAVAGSGPTTSNKEQLQDKGGTSKKHLVVFQIGRKLKSLINPAADSTSGYCVSLPSQTKQKGLMRKSSVNVKSAMPQLGPITHSLRVRESTEENPSEMGHNLPQLAPIAHQVCESTEESPSESGQSLPALGPITQTSGQEEQNMGAVASDVRSSLQIIQTSVTSIQGKKAMKILLSKKPSHCTRNTTTQVTKPTSVTTSSGSIPEESMQSTSSTDTHPQKAPSGLFQCSYCQKTFYIERNLHVHLRSEMPFPCSYCIMSYKTRFEYDIHLMDKHKEIWKLM